MKIQRHTNKGKLAKLISIVVLLAITFLLVGQAVHILHHAHHNQCQTESDEIGDDCEICSFSLSTSSFLKTTLPLVATILIVFISIIYTLAQEQYKYSLTKSRAPPYSMF